MHCRGLFSDVRKKKAEKLLKNIILLSDCYKNLYKICTKC